MGDRLEEIKEHTAWTIDNGLQPRLDDYDLAWLINRVKELEDKTNQRYKQALERIAEHEVYGIDIRTGECLSTDAGEIAKSALRGDGDE